MGRSWRIGTAFGIGLYVHWTFLLIVALILFPNLAAPWAALAGLALVFAIFGCVLLHELGHALMARAYGIGTRDITLFPIGGVARLEGMGSTPGQEIAIAVAGPAVNVVIAAGLWIGMSLAGLLPASALSVDVEASGSLVDPLRELLRINIMLVLFNIIPAFPMDGGRVFRALLALFYDRLRATEIAVLVARLVAAVFIIGGLCWWHIEEPIDFQMSPMLSLIGFFLLMAGQQELAMLRYQDARRRGLVVDDPFATWPRPVVEMPDGPGGPSVEPGFSGFAWDPRLGVWIEWRDGRPVGACSVGRAGRPW